MEHLAFTPALSLAHKIRRKDMSARELLEFYLQRVEHYNPRLNAIIFRQDAKAHQRADAADAALARGEVWGPLHGVPMTIKESFDWIGSPSTLENPRYQHNYSQRDAVAVERLQSAGAIVFGTTNVPLMLADWQSFNDVYGTTNNPWDLTRVPGGSSGGAAAALAAGLTGLELVGDFGGSIRHPAHYGGVFGHKPTYGIVPRQGSGRPGVYAPADMLVSGPLARSADDLAVALKVLAGAAGMDAQGWRLALPEPPKRTLHDYKVAVMLTSPCGAQDMEYPMISNPGLMILAEMICGNAPFDFFPYRSSSYLTGFFIDLDLDYVHDGSTRSLWVTEILKELNAKQSAAPGMPAREMIKVIERLVHPDHFLFDPKVDRPKAIEAVKSCLKSSNLTIAELPNGLVRVCPLHGEFISTAYDTPPPERLLTFRPEIFKVPEKPQNPRLVSVMMPFNTAFRGTYEAVKRVADHMSLECLRADDIWDNSTFMQDIFDLIFCSKVVVVDFTGRNPNVMYETGIAHTLGKTVIPITQSLEDIPSDLGNHRALKYLPNEEGYRDLCNELYKRLKVVMGMTHNPSINRTPNS